ncbi:MAG: histidinol dehydrogenase [Candidatus Brocadiales bacterium]
MMKIVSTSECDRTKLVEGIKKRLNTFEGFFARNADAGMAAGIFGQKNLSAIDSVRRIIADVREKGDDAVLSYSSSFDGVSIARDELRVSEGEIEDACNRVDKSLLKAIKKAKDNIRSFQNYIKINSPGKFATDGVSLELIYRPVEKVGIYVPGGRASYPSTVLMCAVPAQIAGVERVVMCTPPDKDGKVSPERLVAAREAGVTDVYKIGGVQAIAAMAFGTDTVPKVDKIVGPGNVFVTMAKKEVYGYVDLDMLAGPSEVVVLADEKADAALIASDLLSQAEHPGAAILVTPSRQLAEGVLAEVKKQLEGLPNRELTEESLKDLGIMVVTSDMEEAVDIANSIAPEHVELHLEDPEAVVPRLRHAGTIFVGSFSPVAVGDYVAGASHVLPTGGTARFFSGLGVNDFLRRSSVISYSRKALKEAAEDIITMAEAEGLPAHAQSVRMRLK